MSKMARSKSGSRSSRSRSASRSRSRSFSKSRSRSRSLSHPRKRRHSSRSRSRSYSPSHNRERNYPRVYQNRDNFRGNNRGYRRPYYFRPRGGRGFYPRGQYNRGGYVNYNRPNWQNYNRPPYSPRRGRSRSRTPKRRSPSPRSRSHSRNSDKSSSDRSRRSSSSKSSSSNASIVEASKRRARKEKKAKSKDKRAALQTTGEDDSKETSLSGGGEPSSKAETSKDWQDLSFDRSPGAHPSPDRIPTLKSSVQSVVVRRSPRPNPLQKSPPSPQGPTSASGSSFRAMARQSPFEHNTSGMSPPKKGPLSKTSPTITSLYGNQKDEGRTGDAGPYLKRYLEDQKTKASDLDRDSKDKESKLSNLEKMKDRGSPSDFAMNELEKAYRSSQSPKRYKMRDEFDKVKMAEFHKENRYGKDDVDEVEKKVPARSRKDSDFDNDSKPLSKAFATTSKNLDPYDPGKWEEIKFSKDKHRKSEEIDDEDLLFPPERSKKEERAAAKRAEQAQKAAVPEKNFRASFKGMQEKTATSPPRKATDAREREKMAARDMAFAKSTFCISRETGSNIRIDSFDEDLARPSGMLAHERKLSRDLVHTNKKEADFRSIFQHIQSAQPQRSPSELFAQHIVTIVHHVKEHHFGPGGMTLNERFTKYLKKGADQEPTKGKKSPEIHRRIDISPTAFRKGFPPEEAKTSKDSSHKSEGKYKDEPVEIERRKKHKEHKRGRSRETPDSRDSSRSPERSVEKPTKSRKGSKKHKKHRKMRERSPSPSTTASSHSRSPSSHSFRGGEEGQEESEEKEEGATPFDKPRPGAKDFAASSERGRARGNFQYRARGRAWGRGAFTGNSNNDFKNRSKDEEWEPDFAPKTKKYYVKKNPEHDEGETEEKWVNRGRGRGAFPRGRGRFLFRKPGNSPKWSHDKFSGEEGEIEDESGAETRDEKSNSMSAAD